MSVTPLLIDLATPLPPLPTTCCQKGYGLLYHPVERALWMLDFSGSLWRCRDETWSLVSNAEHLMPKGYSQLYSWGFYFYWDGARAAPVCFATGYGGTELPVMGAWDGTRFKEVVPKKALKSSSRDAFAFDPGRQVLVHFVSARDDDARYPKETLHARELDASGVWRDVGPAQAMPDPVDMMAGYDGRLGATVCITSDALAFAWDGATWKEIPVEARYPWFPYATAPAPRGGGMVFAYSPRETGQWPAHLLVLEEGKLRERPVTSLHACGAMAYDPDRDVTYVHGPWFGEGTLQRTLGTYRDGAFFPAGGASAGERPFAAPGHLFRDQERSTLYWLRAAEPARPRAEVLPKAPPSVAQMTTHAGLHAVGGDGAVARLAFGGDAFARRTPAPKGFPQRESTCLGADYEGDRLLLVSGAPERYGPFPKDAWLSVKGKWAKLPLTGAAPALADAAVVYDAARGVWILAGGRDKSYKDGQKTFETDEKKWRSYPTRLLNAKGKETGARHVGLMVHDAPTGLTFCLAGHYAHDRAYVYEGEGVWRLLSDAPAGGAFDVTTRTIAWRGSDGVTTLDLGALLDARAASRGDEAKSKASVGKGAAKRAAARAGESKVTAASATRAPAAPAAVWLRYQDDRSDKVWFARREGAALVVRFGKRGGALQEKTTALKSEALAQTKLDALVREKLDNGYEHAPEGEAIATVPGLRAFHVSHVAHTSRAKEGGAVADSEDVWGGVPRGISAREWPACAECGAPMIHVATFHAHPDRLPLVKHAALMAFVCGGESCEFWEADTGANKVLLRTAKQLAKATLKAAPAGAEVAKAMRLAYREVFEVDTAREPNAASPEARDKVGGYPAFLQFDQVPACPTCDAPMRFVAQLDEHDLNFTGGGMAYIFACREEHAGALFMQR